MHKKTIIEEYLDYHKKYIAKFGEQCTIVLMQVGSFYEAYSTLDEGPNLKKLEEITEATMTRRDTTVDTVDIKNPYMWGFPLVASSKFMTILIDHGYHIVIVDQVTPPPHPKREVVAIHSPATYMESIYRPNSNFVVAITMEEIIQKNGQSLACIGMSAIDVSTGEVYVHESYSKIEDEKLSLDETLRFINGLSPKEIIIYKEKLNKITDEYLKEYLNLEGKLFQFREANKEHYKLIFQKRLLELVYPNFCGVIGIFDSLDLGRTNYARRCLVMLLSYVSDHYEDLIRGIMKPVFYLDGSHLVLGNDAINQLNIIENNVNQNEGAGKIQNLMDVINKASTSMGVRYVKMKFVSPDTNPEIFTKTYDIAEIMMKNNFYQEIELLLSSVQDIERLERRLSLSTLHPSQMTDLINSYQKIIEIFSLIKNNNKLAGHIKTAPLRKSIKKLNAKLSEYIDGNKAKLFNLNDIKENIFNVGIFPELDEMQQKIGLGHEAMMALLEKLDELVTDHLSRGKLVQLKYNKVDGYYFKVTKKRYASLQKALSELKTLKLNGIGGPNSNVEVKISDLTIKETTHDVKISAPFLKDQTTDMDGLIEKISSITYEKYIGFMKEIYDEFRSTLKETTKMITMIDYYHTIAKVAREYNYCRPIVKIKEKTGYVCAKELRHPIVERIIGHEYIPHDIEIGTNLKGMLIYGLNSAGKSVLMKAIGIAVIMAQAGFFVPAKSFIFYPYKALYTRITGNDNLFRGLSSFSLEMVELNAILKRADNSTLVIGDEICRGTEHISGNALVATTLLRLSDLSATFVFATHLHEMIDLEEIKNRKNIRAFHLSVDIDSKTDKLIYDRTLKEGSGERIYGILVAKNIIKDVDFIKKALEIKNILLDNDPESAVVSTKKSRYNPNILMDRCDICGKKNTIAGSSLETHHINHQKDCVDGFVKNKPHIQKNQIFNLMVCCQKCHDQIHSGKINPKGYQLTSNGRRMMFNE